jgi:hypothetical protein
MLKSADLPHEAQQVFHLNGYHWDNLAYAFRRARRVGHESVAEYQANPRVISFEELEDHGFFVPDITDAEKAKSLKWLEQRLKLD